PMRARVWSIAFAPDGTTLAAGGDSGDAAHCSLWDAATGKKIRDIDDAKGALVATAVTFSPDGKTLATGSRDGPLYLWEAATGKQRRELALDGIGVASLAFAPDGKSLAAGCYDGTVLVWNLADLARTDERNLGNLWADLADADAGRAYAAVMTMATM